MKKTLMLLMLIISFGTLVSCSDSSSATSVPETDCRITLTFDNVAVINGNIYATQDYALEIESVNFKSPDNSTKAISDVEYTVDGKIAQKAIYSPFVGRIDTRDLSTGTHPLGIHVELIQSDNSQVPDNMEYNFIVVPTVDDLPSGAELGTFTQTFRVDPA